MHLSRRCRRFIVLWLAVGLPLFWITWCSIPKVELSGSSWPWTPFGGRPELWRLVNVAAEPGQTHDTVYMENLRTGERIQCDPRTDGWVTDAEGKETRVYSDATSRNLLENRVSGVIRWTIFFAGLGFSWVLTLIAAWVFVIAGSTRPRANEGRDSVYIVQP